MRVWSIALLVVLVPSASGALPLGVLAAAAGPVSGDHLPGCEAEAVLVVEAASRATGVPLSAMNEGVAYGTGTLVLGSADPACAAFFSFATGQGFDGSGNCLVAPDGVVECWAGSGEGDPEAPAGAHPGTYLRLAPDGGFEVHVEYVDHTHLAGALTRVV